MSVLQYEIYSKLKFAKPSVTSWHRQRSGRPLTPISPCSDARVMPHGGAESDNIIILGFPTDPMLHTPSFLNEIMHGITLK
ncbi:hypothetical protein OUZ56_011269 [Daphnia magna]|uniref:Uncharacterized protein n=1 Tax=Daphnia magna TaxID=35525 RepID=A0ABQ9YZX0_9CRUS|nr:hypothetical protein OUZ56_011269 [Daphnia magna]